MQKRKLRLKAKVTIIIGLSILIVIMSIFLIHKSEKKHFISTVCEYDPKVPLKLGIDLFSEQYLVFALDSQTDYYAEKNDEMIYPASLTKLMTLDTILNLKIDLDTKIEVTNLDLNLMYSRNASVAGLIVGREYTIKDLLYAMILPSGADACEALRRYLASLDIDLVSEMNKRAKALKMNDSNFSNTTGLYEDDNFSTLDDLKKLALDLYHNEVAIEIIETLEYESSDGDIFRSTLSRFDYDLPEGVVLLGGKTGYTYESKQNLLVFYNVDGKDYCAIVAKADDDEIYLNSYHFYDFAKILEYLY